jgi:hypothetical protein
MEQQLQCLLPYMREKRFSMMLATGYMQRSPQLGTTLLPPASKEMDGPSAVCKLQTGGAL